jgi:hypothetical protein
METKGWLTTLEVEDQALLSRKVMLILADSKCIILEHCIPQKKTMNGVYCANTRKTHLRIAIQKERTDNDDDDDKQRAPFWQLRTRQLVQKRF